MASNIITADNITDEQIQWLRRRLARLAKQIGEYDIEARDQAIADAGACTTALTTAEGMAEQRKEARAYCVGLLRLLGRDRYTRAARK